MVSLNWSDQKTEVPHCIGNKMTKNKLTSSLISLICNLSPDQNLQGHPVEWYSGEEHQWSNERGSDVHSSWNHVEFHFGIGRFGGFKFPRCHVFRQEISYIFHFWRNPSAGLHIFLFSVHVNAFGGCNPRQTRNGKRRLIPSTVAFTSNGFKIKTTALLNFESLR